METIAQEQEKKYLGKTGAFEIDKAVPYADVGRARQQFERRLSGSGNTNLEQYNSRAARRQALP